MPWTEWITLLLLIGNTVLTWLAKKQINGSLEKAEARIEHVIKVETANNRDRR